MWEQDHEVAVCDSTAVMNNSLPLEEPCLQKGMRYCADDESNFDMESDENDSDVEENRGKDVPLQNDESGRVNARLSAMASIHKCITVVLLSFYVLRVVVHVRRGVLTTRRLLLC